MINSLNQKYKEILIFIIISMFFFSSCVKWNPQSSREIPTNAEERAKKNISEGRSLSVGTLLGKRGGNFEFSTSNPLWRATIETLDFLPLAVVDYSGGIIITDWYSDSKSNESIKITVRFNSNEIKANSLKILVYKKECDTNLNCKTFNIKSAIGEQLNASILKKASILEKELKKIK
jgi:hypothetical protein